MPPYFVPPFMQPQRSIQSGQSETRQQIVAEISVRGSSPVISDPDQEISPLERYCIWLGGRYTRQKKDLEAAAEVLIDQAYTLETMRKEKDSLLKEIIGKRGTCYFASKKCTGFLERKGKL